MKESSVSKTKLLPHLFRLEYSKMTAVLCRHFGLKHIEIAEDIASETFLKATETWTFNNIPENPTAWLYAVARNKTKDYLKRQAIFESQVKPAIKTHENFHEDDIDFTPKSISDSQLAMIFAVCNPGIATEGQICMALQILCGFSIQEIANAFLAKDETIKKRLFRARTKLREDQFRIAKLSESEISSRLDTVLQTLYLLFNEGYYSKTNDHIIRKDLCYEAMRLTLLLTENELTNTPKANALLALICFQSSRLEARINDSGESVLFEQQDRSLWNQELIMKGNYYLVRSATGNEVSKYHLEASIAYWHSTPDDHEKWTHILKLYDQLLFIDESPMIALNRSFALAKANGKPEAIAAAEKLELNGNVYYHSLLGDLYTDIDNKKAVEQYEAALKLTTATSDKITIGKHIEKLRHLQD